MYPPCACAGDVDGDGMFLIAIDAETGALENTTVPVAALAPWVDNAAFGATTADAVNGAVLLPVYDAKVDPTYSTPSAWIAWSSRLPMGHRLEALRYFFPPGGGMPCAALSKSGGMRNGAFDAADFGTPRATRAKARLRRRSLLCSFSAGTSTACNTPRRASRTQRGWTRWRCPSTAPRSCAGPLGAAATFR